MLLRDAVAVVGVSGLREWEWVDVNVDVDCAKLCRGVGPSIMCRGKDAFAGTMCSTANRVYMRMFVTGGSIGVWAGE